MLKKIAIVVLLVTGTNIFADWLDDLADLVGPVKQWQAERALEIIERYKAQDEKRVKDLEAIIEKNKDNGFWAHFYKAGYYAKLTGAKADLTYDQKILKALKELPENRKDREKFVQSLVTLYNNNQELNNLKNALEKSINASEKLKLGAQIAAKHTEIGTRKTFIKSTFLFVN